MHHQHISSFLETLSSERKASIEKLHDVIVSNLPTGFDVHVANGMLNYVVPLSRYPKGYHPSKGEPLPFISLASQKNHVALYHMGLYGSPKLMSWFEKAYAEHSVRKLDMGKSCIRFKHPESIPLNVIGELCQKISVEDYIDQYEAILNR